MTPLTNKEKILSAMFSFGDVSPVDDHRDRARRVVKITLISLMLFTLLQAGSYAFLGGPEVLNYRFAAIAVFINLFLVLLVAAFGIFNYSLVDKWGWNRNKSYYISIHASMTLVTFALLAHIHIAGSFCTLITALLPTLALAAAWLIGWRQAWFYFILGSAGLIALFALEKYGILPYFPLHSMRHQVPASIFLETRFLASNIVFFLLNGVFALSLLVFFQKKLQNRNLQLAKALKQLSLLASTDPLTELLNRRRALLELEEEIDRAKRDQAPLTVVLIDIDDFKRINDTFGHPAGDKVLFTMASLLIQAFRSYDVIARVGGEEFLVVIPNAEATQGKELLERARKIIEDARFPVSDKRTVSITASFGASIYDPMKPVSIEHLLCRVDDALYESKRKGKNCISFIDAVKMELDNADKGSGTSIYRLCENSY
jgi:diguanylate cyclase (GGDEF)-like protein